MYVELCGKYSVVVLVILCQQNHFHDHMDHPVIQAQNAFKFCLGQVLIECDKSQE